MSRDDVRGKRENEEDYFRKQDLELIEKMRKTAAAERSHRELGARTGLTDPDLIAELERLGFTTETIGLLPLVPVLQVAWAEGGVTAAERALIADLARHRGIDKDSAAGRQLTEWLEAPPAPSVFARATRLIKAMLAAGSQETQDLSADDLVKYCERIAAASGGILGLHKVSSEERAALSEIQDVLKGRSQP